MASIKDVAKMANTSVATVSRVLVKKGYVAEETKRKILTAMEELDYVPNELARQLFSKRTKIIGIMVPDVANPFFGSVTKYLEMKLYECGYKTMLCNSIVRSGREKEYIDMVRRHIIDGVIIASHSLDIEEYGKIKIPIVTLDRILDEKTLVVHSDHKKGGRIAAEKLISNGCKNVIHLIGSRGIQSPSHERHFVFEKVLRKNKVNVETINLSWNLFDFNEYISIAKQTLGARKNIDGIFSVDLVVLAFIKVLLDMGKKIPEDVRVVGYDGIPTLDYIRPSITTVVQPIEDIANETVQAIVRLVEGQKINEHEIVLDVYLRNGETTFN